MEQNWSIIYLLSGITDKKNEHTPGGIIGEKISTRDEGSINSVRLQQLAYW